MLVYTRDMITAIVQARGDITTVHKLTDIVKDHVSGNFNDVRVSQCTLFALVIVFISNKYNIIINYRSADLSMSENAKSL